LLVFHIAQHIQLDRGFVLPADSSC
jgi:hypothetical protein